MIITYCENCGTVLIPVSGEPHRCPDCVSGQNQRRDYPRPDYVSSRKKLQLFTRAQLHQPNNSLPVGCVSEPPPETMALPTDN